jgi:hypothetical protein
VGGTFSNIFNRDHRRSSPRHQAHTLTIGPTGATQTIALIRVARDRLSPSTLGTVNPGRRQRPSPATPTSKD